MEQALIDELRGGIPALLALVPAVFVVHLLFRRPVLRSVLPADPGVARLLSETLAAHRATRDEALRHAAPAEGRWPALETREESLLGNIQRFFGLRDARD